MHLTNLLFDLLIPQVIYWMLKYFVAQIALHTKSPFNLTNAHTTPQNTEIKKYV